jgi:diguanylate cyclase (GGDEF)-like protein
MRILSLAIVPLCYCLRSLVQQCSHTRILRYYAKVGSMFMRFLKKKPSFSSRAIFSDSPSAQRFQAIRFSRLQHSIVNPLLNIPIGRRLTVAFLIPALLAALLLGSVGTENQQRLTQEATFCRNLLNAYTSLSEEANAMQQIQTDLSNAATYAASPHPQMRILEDDQTTIQTLSAQVNTTFVMYYQHDLIKDSPDLVALFTEAGHGTQIEDQLVYSEGILQSWQTYRSIQEQALSLIMAGPTQAQSTGMVLPGNLTPAQILILTQATTAFTDVMRDLNVLVKFNGNLGNSLQDAASVETHRLLASTLLAMLGGLLGISFVGWLIFITLVQRLQRLRSVIQVIANGQMDARLDVNGRDEIAYVSAATNTMLDTLVGLLEETKQQRDKLSNAQELQRLHQQLQQEHEALNEANTRLATLATRDPLTGLPNHRTIMQHVEDALLDCQHTQSVCAIVFLDIDHFKHINDTWGHRAGDAILREVGRRLEQSLRCNDFVGRYGGEEFAMVLANTNQDEAMQIAERLRIILAEQPCIWEGEEDGIQKTNELSITASIGIAMYQKHGTKRDTLIEAADTAMYHAKHTGRNRVCLAGDKDPLEQPFLIKEEKRTPPSDLAAIQVLTAAADVHDRGTSAHAQRMVLLTTATTRMLHRSEEEIHLVHIATLLHDIGKIGIPDAILNKPGPLTDEEWTIMRQHPTLSREILEPAGGIFELLSHIVVAHHERWDGFGYPNRLIREEIPLSARIISVVDTYDAMTSQRPYRNPLPVSAARAELQRNSGSQFDPQVVEAFLNVLDAQEESITEMPLLPTECATSLPFVEE